MTGGETAALVIGGVVVVGGGAYLLLRTPAAPVPVTPFGSIPIGYQYASAAPTPPGAPPPAPSATANLLSGINGLNEAGCQIAAQKVGAGGLAAMGCADFLKYATPLGAAEIINSKVLTKIPGVAPVENAVSNVANKSVSAVKGAVSKVLSFL